MLCCEVQHVLHAYICGRGIADDAVSSFKMESQPLKGEFQGQDGGDHGDEFHFVFYLSLFGS